MIGNNCKIQNNVSVFDNVTLEDDVFVVQAWFSPTSTTREQQSRKNEYRNTLVGQGATIGANCTIVCGGGLAVMLSSELRR